MHSNNSAMNNESNNNSNSSNNKSESELHARGEESEGVRENNRKYTIVQCNLSKSFEYEYEYEYE